jgi:hypothetical protein
MSHFRAPPPAFIGGRQPNAPRLGLPQSGPTPQPPPPSGAVAAASLSLIISAWQPYAPAQPQTRIAPLIPAAAVASQPPIRGTQNLSIVVNGWIQPAISAQGQARIAQIFPIINQAPLPATAQQLVAVASWNQPAIAAQGSPRIAPLIPAAIASNPPAPAMQLRALQAWWIEPTSVVSLASFAAQGPSADQPPVLTTANLSLVIRGWNSDPQPAQGNGRIAPVVPAIAAPSQPPVLRSTNLGLIIRGWYREPPAAQGYADIAPLAPAPAVPDQPPVPGKSTLALTLAGWIPPHFIAQGFGHTAPLIPPAATPDAPPVPGRQALGLLIDSWRPAHFISQGYCEIAANLPIAAAPPVSRQQIQLVLSSWEPRSQQPQQPAGIAPLLTAPAIAAQPPIGFPQTLRVIVDSWVAPRFDISLRGRAPDYSQPVVYVSNSRRLVRARPSNRIVIARPRLK